MLDPSCIFITLGSSSNPEGNANVTSLKKNSNYFAISSTFIAKYKGV